MSSQLTSYSAYKPTGLPWLPQIPEHWALRKNKYLLRLREEVSLTGAETLLCLSQYTGITARKLSSGRIAESLIGYRIVHEGDIVMNIMLAWNGSTAMSALDGIVSPAYAVFTVKRGVSPKFLHYLFKTPQILQYFKSFSSGVIESRLRLYPDELAKLFSVVPPPDEQTQIVRYLDSMTAKINKLIRAKKKQIALLQEQKQAIINQAVTKGLNPDAEMKDSGVDWLGQIPKHWKCLPLRRCASLVKTGGTPAGVHEGHFQENGFNWFTPGDFSDELWLSHSERQLSQLGKSSVKIFPPNTIMMIGIGSIGKVAISRDFASCNQQINGIVLKKDVNVVYIAQHLRLLSGHIQSTSKYTTLPIINQCETKSLFVSVPPLKEQNDIADFLCSKEQYYSNIFAKINNEIVQLIEYKNGLISSVVTGRIDVRNIQVDAFDPADLVAESEDDPVEESSVEKSEEQK